MCARISMGGILITLALLINQGCSVRHHTIVRPVTSARYGGSYDFGSTLRIAVYRYAYQYADLDPGAIVFTITKPQEVRLVLDGIDVSSSEQLDGTALGTEPNAYLYVQNASGSIHQYRTVLDWAYLLDGQDWKALHKIKDDAAAKLRVHMKE